MKTSSNKKKKKNPLSTRAARRGMTLAEWYRQNEWPTLIDCPAKGDSYGKIRGLHPEDATLIARLWQASEHRGIHIRTLATMYFPEAVNIHCAVAQLSYELRCCHDLTDALERLHHPKQAHRFTCAQVRQIFLLYGSPGA